MAFANYDPWLNAVDLRPLAHSLTALALTLPRAKMESAGMAQDARLKQSQQMTEAARQRLLDAQRMGVETDTSHSQQEFAGRSDYGKQLEQYGSWAPGAALAGQNISDIAQAASKFTGLGSLDMSNPAHQAMAMGQSPSSVMHNVGRGQNAVLATNPTEVVQRGQAYPEESNMLTPGALSAIMSGFAQNPGIDLQQGLPLKVDQALSALVDQQYLNKPQAEASIGYSNLPTAGIGLIPQLLRWYMQYRAMQNQGAVPQQQAPPPPQSAVPHYQDDGWTITEEPQR